jgi:LmbE family N-acetylglucosaminyl deacetylase
VLVVASHPDDEMLGCGATMARMAEGGSEIHILILGEGVTSRQQERDPAAVSEELAKLHADVQRAAKIVGASSTEVLAFPDNRFDTVPLLDLVKAIERKIDDIRPRIIFTHHANDLNVDHQRTFQAVVTGSRPLEGQSVREIYSCEVPSSTEWQVQPGVRPFAPSQFVEVLGKHIDAKIGAMESYESERRAFPHPRSPEALRALARWRGSSCGAEFAEAFEVVRRLV